MVGGEFVSTVFALAVLVAGGIALIEWSVWLARGWAEWLAAEQKQPDYRGPCRCRACRLRSQEPCSDYDGD